MSNSQVHIDREIPISGTYDAVVCGGGPSGCAAALAARREGLSVLLVESQASLAARRHQGLFPIGWAGAPRMASGS